MIITKKMVVAKTEEIEIGIKCDVCKRAIENKQQYWRVTTGHHDWGNDSIESIEHIDVCSAQCMVSIVNDYINRSDRNSKNGRNSEYIDIERETLWVSVDG